MDGAQTEAARAAGERPVRGQTNDRGGMFHYHVAKVRPLIVIHEEKKAAATAAATSLTSALDVMVADLNNFAGPKVDRAWVKRRIDKASQSQRDLLEALELERWGDDIQGIAEQLDAFGGAETPESVRDARYWNSQGYQDGLNGLPSNPPDGMHSMFDNDYRTGWSNGQTAQMDYIALGASLKEKQGTPNTEPPVQLDGDGDGDELDTDQLNDAARKLSNDPEFMGDKAGKKSGAGDIKPRGQAAKKTGVH